jgi:hypothetical protein
MKRTNMDNPSALPGPYMVARLAIAQHRGYNRQGKNAATASDGTDDDGRAGP